MIKKLIKIENIGKFADFKAAGDAELRKLTLVFAENGRGKTTLCDILRSLQGGNPDYINGRRMLGSTDLPRAEIRVDGAALSFASGCWNGTVPDIAIFDSTFIFKNVYAGDHVSIDHRRNLYQVIVGEEGVTLAREVDRLDASIREQNSSINEKKSGVQGFVPRAITIDVFLALPKDDEVASKIKEKETTLAALTRANDIRTRSTLSRIVLPSFPARLSEVLSKSLQDISKDAERLVRDHIASHTKGASEGWLQQGVRYEKDFVCPFCGHSLEDSALFRIYPAYFSQSYGALKEEISSMDRQTRDALGTNAIATLQRTASSNIALNEFWSSFVTYVAPTISADDIESRLNAVVAVISRYVQKKLDSPLEPIIPGEDFRAATRSYDEIVSSIEQYNHAVDIANVSIAARKISTETGDINQEKSALALLLATQLRHGDEATTSCDAYVKAQEHKRELEEQKAAAKRKLDAYTAKVFAEYQGRINGLLERFNAGFRVAKTTGTFAGGRPTSTYQIVINETPVDLGDIDTPVGTPSFRNTLSSGDKSTLGLAFFLAQLEQDPKLSDKIVILDDPFSSQDRFRRTCTQQLIRRLANKAKQVIVLSHDPSFLKLIWDSASKEIVKTLQLARAGNCTVVNEWDVEAEVRGSYLRDRDKLMEYDQDGAGEARDVARCIRPVLEGYLRLSFPGCFADNEWLGDFISKIRAANNSSPLYPLQPSLDELTDINDFSKRYHHDQNPGADTEPINDGELQSFVRRTLNVIGSTPMSCQQTPATQATTQQLASVGTAI